MAKLSAKQNSGNRGKMNRKKIPVIFLLCILTLSTCGLEDYFYLPQISEGRITTDSDEITTKVEINTPSLSSIDYPHARGYVIFYKIYICSESNVSNGNISNSRIKSDYDTLYPYTNPANPSSIPSLTTFSSRGFYELEFDGGIKSTILSTSGSSFDINFPLVFSEGFPNSPYVLYGVTGYRLLRSKNGFNPLPNNRYFLSSDDIRNSANATSAINADVSKGNENGIYGNAYTLMYIVAVGQNTNTFQRVYGKPTFISIFRLPTTS